MNRFGTKLTIVILLILIIYVSVNSWFKTHRPELFVWCDEDKENAKWVASEKSWLDHKACRWLGVCGISHMHFSHYPFGHSAGESHTNRTDDWKWRREWKTGVHPLLEGMDKDNNIPDYVFEYAPLVHLFSGEQFWPSDPAEHLYHTTPELNYTQITSRAKHATLSDLDELNQWQHGHFVFLTSNDNVEDRPDWLESRNNMPTSVNADNASLHDNDAWVHRPARTYLQGLRDAAIVLGKDFDNYDTDPDRLDTGDEATSDETVRLLRQEAQILLQQELGSNSARSSSKPYKHKIKGGRSSAPAILIVVPKADGVLDAFWFFFYSFNLGISVLGVRFGNHVGDWEHTAVRFRHGKPEAVYFSEHSFGSAYTYEAVEKFGKRPIVYSATGSHAMYSTPGVHPYILPFGILADQTDRGPLWDPALNHHGYTYDYEQDNLRPSARTPDSPTSWFHFTGHWGDKFYPLGDSRQYRLFGQYHFVNGPRGPKAKRLGRKHICGTPDSTPCVLKHWLGGGGKIPRTDGHGEEADEWSAAYRINTKFELK